MAGHNPSQPLAELLPRRFTGPMCAPHQKSEEDIHAIELDIKDDGLLHSRFVDVQNRRLAKLIRNATLVYMGKPVTPRRNRSNPPPLNELDRKTPDDNEVGGFSYHIIRLLNTLSVEDRGKLVDLLIDENSQYCVGYRRGVREEGVPDDWSEWFRARGNYAWPSFLPSVELPIGGDHSIEVEIGGAATLEDILRSLWRWPDDRHDTDALQRGFLRGVVVFCETLRQLSISNAAVDRIRLNEAASALSRRSWKRIRTWKSGCVFILKTAGLYHGRVNEEKFKKYRALGYNSFQELLNEYRLLKWEDTLVHHYKGEDRQWRKRKHPGAEIENPGFDPPGPLE